MHRIGSVPWTIRSDTPKELLFLGYIARHEGFHVPEDAPPASPVEGEWQAWWQFLLTHTFSMITLEVQRDNPGITGVAFARELGMRYRSVYDAPQFTVLADRPALQALCLRYWPDYHREWETVGGNGQRFFDDVSQCLHDLQLQDIVHESVRSTGKRLVPFTLSFDFLYWPENYENHLSATHIMLGKRFVDNGAVLRPIIRDIIIDALA